MSTLQVKRGRPHNAEGTREAILNAAEKVFAEHGFDGSRIDAIAKEAGYNKSLIFQYFGDKLRLYEEVVRRTDRDMSGIQTQFLGELLDSETTLSSEKLKDMLRAGMRMYFDYLLEHPRILRIYNWETAEGWQTYAKIMSQRDYEDVVQFRAALRKVEQAGLLRTDMDAMVQLVMAVYTIPYYLALLPLFRLIVPNGDLSSPEALVRARDYLIEFVIRGMMAEPAEAKPPAGA